VRLPYVDPVGGLYSIQEHLFTSSLHQVIRLKSLIGVQIIWNGNSYLELSVPAAFRRAVCGLCGQCLNYRVMCIIIIIFLRPLAQSRRLKIKQLWLDMALTQI